MDTNREIIKEKDEKIAQLERLLMELKDAQQQSAATVAVDYNSRSLSASKERVSKTSRWMIISAVPVVVVIIAVVIGLFGGNTFKQESVTYVEQVQELATLATAKAHMKVVLQEEDNKILGKDIPLDLPGTKRKLLLVVPATVIAGVDLKEVTSEDMVINEETKEIDITLPYAKLIQEPAIQMDKVQRIVDGGLLSGDVNWDEGFDLVAQAQEQISQEAISEGLLTTAEKNAEKVLKEFFKNIDGYTVNVTFN